MSIQSRLILKNLKQASKNSEYPFAIDHSRKVIRPVGLNEPSFSYSEYQNEIGSILDLLEKQDFIKYVTDDHSQFCLNQNSIHFFQFKISNFRNFLVKNLISIIALIISVFSVLKSYGIDIIAIISKMK